MVSVQPSGARPDIRVASAKLQPNEDGGSQPVIELVNDASGYGYLSQGDLLVVERDEVGTEVARRTLSGAEIRQTIGYGLIGSGRSREVRLPMTASARGKSVDVRYIPSARQP
jgi:hypothetical protein